MFLSAKYWYLVLISVLVCLDNLNLVSLATLELESSVIPQRLVFHVPCILEDFQIEHICTRIGARELACFCQYICQDLQYAIH